MGDLDDANEELSWLDNPDIRQPFPKCSFPGCTRPVMFSDLCYQHAEGGFKGNFVLMNPQPLLGFFQVKAGWGDKTGKWCHWERGWGPDKMIPLLNQPSCARGVKLDPKDGLWYWLIDS